MTKKNELNRVVAQLVKSHFETEEGIDQIIWFKDGDEVEIRLIEINPNTLPTEAIEVFYFSPSKDVPLPVRIADVTPEEWEKVKRGDIPLPDGWTLNKTEIFNRQERQG